MPTVSVTFPRARKAHRCDSCCAPIPVGTQHRRWVGRGDEWFGLATLREWVVMGSSPHPAHEAREAAIEAAARAALKSRYLSIPAGERPAWSDLRPEARDKLLFDAAVAVDAAAPLLIGRLPEERNTDD